MLAYRGRASWPGRCSFTYGTAPFYDHYAPKLEAALADHTGTLGDLNVALLPLVGGWLGIATPMVRASELPGAPIGQADTLASLAGATLVDDAFAEEPRYAHNGAWTPGLSVVDALMAVGPQAAAGLAEPNVTPHSSGVRRG